MKSKSKRIESRTAAKSQAKAGANNARASKAVRKPKNAHAGPPLPPKNAEIISRQGFLIDATGKGPHAVPEVVLLANVSALRYLAELFSYLADRAKAGDDGIEAAIAGLPPTTTRSTRV